MEHLEETNTQAMKCARINKQRTIPSKDCSIKFPFLEHIGGFHVLKVVYCWRFAYADVYFQVALQGASKVCTGNHQKDWYWVEFYYWIDAVVCDKRNRLDVYLEIALALKAEIHL